MKKFLTALTAIAMSITLASCAGGTQKPAEAEKPAEEPAAATSEFSYDFNGRTMNVVATSDSYVPLFDKFTEKTGAKVEFLSMSSGEVLSRVQAEGGAPMADLWFGGGLDAFMKAKDDGLLEKIEPKGAQTIGENYKDKDGYWYSKGLTVVGFVGNNAVLEELGLEMPKTWEDLIKPEYQGEVIMSSPAVSGTNYAAVKGLLDMFGDGGWDYITSLDANIPFYGKRGKDPQEKTASGEFAVGIIPVDKGAFDAAEENNLTVVYPEDGIPWVPEGIAVFKGSENTDIATAFIEFMLLPENMQMLAEIDGKDGAQMVVDGIKGYELGLPKDKLIKQDLSTFGQMREEILNKWAEITAGKETV